MTDLVTGRWQKAVAALAAMACAVGIFLFASPPAEAMPRLTQKQTLQLIAAQEKLSYDVLREMDRIHPDGPFAMMARAEREDLQAVRRLLALHGWRDLTRSDPPGFFAHFPVLEQAYWDLIVDGQSSIDDGARVGILVQQMSVNLIYQALDMRWTKRDRRQLVYIKNVAISRMSTYYHVISVY